MLLSITDWFCSSLQWWMSGLAEVVFYHLAWGCTRLGEDGKITIIFQHSLCIYTDPMGITGRIWKNSIVWNGQKNSTSAQLEGKPFKQIFPNSMLRFLPPDKVILNVPTGFWSKPECLTESATRNMQMSLCV